MEKKIILTEKELKEEFMRAWVAGWYEGKNDSPTDEKKIIYAEDRLEQINH